MAEKIQTPPAPSVAPQISTSLSHQTDMETDRETDLSQLELPLQAQLERAERLGHHPQHFALTMGQPGDTYEQEVDQMPEPVMPMPDPLAMGAAPSQMI